MVEMASEAGMKVVLAAPPPISTRAAAMFGHPELHAPLCAKIAALCHRQALVHVDYAKCLAGADGEPVAHYTTDGVHLTRRGYLAMRGQAREALRMALTGATEPR
jgi:lysophospholipase L1-like esterase